MANLYKMYKGLEGSPMSKIVQGISVSTTTIVVQDPSVLPAAPNFACLFDDTGKIEVVEYTQKSGQTLTCIRGVSGQRLEWPIATSIARNFTAIDHNNMVDNVSMMNVELNELILECGYIFESIVQGNFVQQVLQMAGQVEILNGEVNTMLDSLTTLETQLQENEQARQTNETSRQAAESSRASAEAQRTGNETTRQTNETARQTAEGQRASTESLRVNAETSRQTNETSRVAAETSRATAEDARVANETNRQSQLTAAINSASNYAQLAEGYKNTAGSSAQYAESMKDQAASYAIDSEAAAVRAEFIATSLGNIQDWALQPTKPTYTPSEVGAAPEVHSHYVSSILDFPTSMPASDVYPWAKDQTKPSYTYNEIIEKPESFPASDVSAWAKQPNKPSYTYSEVGAAPLSHTHDYAPISHNHTKSQITDFPASMPASDVSAWAKQPSKPTYTPSEVGAAESSHDHTKSQITDFPTSMPASDVPAWAKSPTKPTYTPAEIGALASNAKAVDSDKLDGYHVSDLMVGNPNILRNAYFINPINQRGCPLGQYLPANSYGLDRWLTTASAYQYVSGGLYVPTVGDHHLVQRIEGTRYGGKTYTASVAVGLNWSGWIDKVTLTLPVGSQSTVYFPGLTGVRVLLIDYGTYLEYRLITEQGAMPLSALKLELGTVSTLHLDPPMDRAAELVKCKLYFERLETIVLTGTATNYAFGFTFAEKRITPTVTTVSMSSIESGASVTPSGYNSVRTKLVGSVLGSVVANSAYHLVVDISSDL